METRKKHLIKTGYTEEAIKELEFLIITKKIRCDKIQSAEVLFDSAKSVDETDEWKLYPLKLFGAKTEVWLADVAVGYRGVGPLGVIKVLEMVGFNVSDDEKLAILGQSKEKYSRLVLRK